MSKTKSAFFCQNCGYESPKWLGKCPACNEWNTMTEELIVKGSEKNQQTSWQEMSGEKKIENDSIIRSEKCRRKKN